MEFKMWLLNFGLLSILCLESVFGAKGFAYQPETATWEDALNICGKNIMVPGRRFRVKALDKVMSEGDRVWLYGWRSVSDITPDNDGKLRTLKVDFSKPRTKNPCAVVCTDDSAYFVGADTAGSVTDGDAVCQAEGGRLVDIRTEEDTVGVVGTMGSDDPHWAMSIRAETSKIKQCLYADKKEGDLIYEYGDCNEKYHFICVSGKDFSPLISLKIARFDEFETLIDEYTASLPTTSSSAVPMGTTSSSVEMSSSSEATSMPSSSPVVEMPKSSPVVEMPTSSPTVVSSTSSSTAMSQSSSSEATPSSSAAIVDIPSSSSVSVDTQSSSSGESVEATEASAASTTSSAVMVDEIKPTSSASLQTSTATESPLGDSYKPMTSSVVTEISFSEPSMEVSTVSSTSTTDDLFAGVLIQDKTDSSSSIMTSYTSSPMVSAVPEPEIPEPEIPEPEVPEPEVPEPEVPEPEVPEPELPEPEVPEPEVPEPEVPEPEVPEPVVTSSNDVFVTPTPSQSFSATQTLETPVTTKLTEVPSMNKYVTSSPISSSSAVASSSDSAFSVSETDTPATSESSSEYIEVDTITSSSMYISQYQGIVSTSYTLLPTQSYIDKKKDKKKDSSEMYHNIYNNYAIDYQDYLQSVYFPYEKDATETKSIMTSLSPSSSSSSAETTTDIDPMYSDIYKIQPTSSSQYMEMSSTAMFTTSNSAIITPSSKEDYYYDSDEYDYDYNAPTAPTTPIADDTDKIIEEDVDMSIEDDEDTSIEDDLVVEEFDEDNASAGTAKENLADQEEGVEVGVWVAFGILIALVIVSLALAVFLYKRRQQQKSKDITPNNGAAAGATGDTVELRDSRSPSRENGTPIV